MTLIPARGFARILRFLNFCNHLLKSLGDIGVEPRTGLGESALELFSNMLSFVCGDLPLLWLEICFVPNKHQWDPIGTLYDQSVDFHTTRSNGRERGAEKRTAPDG